jgi:transposase
MAMYGCGKTTGPQLMAEIGDPLRFAGKKNLVNFAGIAPGDNQSGAHQQKSNPVSKKGSPHLRKTLFQVMSTHLKHSPASEPVYRFLDQKRAEGKPYYVYMTAGANKFLRIYYAKVKAFLTEETLEPASDAA